MAIHPSKLTSDFSYFSVILVFAMEKREQKTFKFVIRNAKRQSKCRAGIKVVKSAKVSSEEAAKATTNCMWFHNFFA